MIFIQFFTYHLKYFLWQRLFAIPHHAVHKFAECEWKMNNKYNMLNVDQFTKFPKIHRICKTRISRNIINKY